MPQINMGEFRLLKSIRRVVKFLLMIIPVISLSQISKPDIRFQRLRLQLGASLLNVATQTQVDLDSGLLLSASRNHLTRMSVIGENYEDIISDPANKWINTENIVEAKKQASLSKGLTRIQLLNLIGAYYAFQPMSRKKNLDSALKYLLQAKQEAEKSGDEKSLCQTLIYLGKCYLKMDDADLPGKTFAQAINLAGKYGYNAEQAMALMYWAAYSPFNPNTITERIQHLNEAVAIYEQTGNKESQALSLTYLGYLNFALGKIPESKKYAGASLLIQKNIGFPYTHFTNDLLCFIANVSTDIESRLKIAMEEVKAAESTHDSTALAYIYARRGNAESFNNTGSETANQLYWFNKSLAEFIRTRDLNMYGIVENINIIYEETGKSEETIRLLKKLLADYPPSSPFDKMHAFIAMGYAYQSRNDVKEAEKYLLMAERVQQEVIRYRGNVETNRLNVLLGNLYFKMHQYAKSRQYYEAGLSTPTFSNTGGIYLADINYGLALLDSIEGKFKDAFLHIDAAKKYADTFYKKQDFKKINELRIQYETEKKDNNIKILNQQAALQNAQIKQDKLTRTIMIGGAAILVLFLILLYSRYRSKQEQERVISQKNISLQHLVEEKEFLMKEIHHRVKNNLQIVISLLNTQSKFLDNEEAIAAISESRHRMQAMSLIHQKLYQSDSVAFVAMPGYIREMVDYLDMSFNVGQRIKFELNIEPIDLDISQAIPVGLILNEAVTNCIKHAFTDRPNGIIRVIMKKMPDELIFLEISDNGKGLPPEFDFTTSQSLGIRLIRGLIEQIGGELNFSDKDGCRIATTFKQDLVLRPVAV